MHDETNFTALITGATSGFGEACARRFARHPNARLILAGRRSERLLALQEELACPVHIVRLDVRDRRAVEECVSTLPPEFSSISLLINNAGLALGLSPAHEASVEDWETMVDTNCKGLMYCTRAVLPGMVRRGRGHIINMGSIAANYAYFGGNVYGGTKAFVQQFTLNLRAELLGTGVRVTDIQPGMAETEFSIVRYHGDSAKAAKVYEGMRPLSAVDVAETAYWCATLPGHVNINSVELMPTAQAPGGLAVHRK